MAGAIGPAIGLGSTLLGGFFNRQKTPKRSPEEQAAFKQAGTTAGGLQLGGQQLAQFGQGQLQGASQFLTPLLSGDRSAALAATSPERGQITSFFRGAGRRIREESRGGVRDLAIAQNARDKAGSLAQLIPSLRVGAAQTAGQLGTATAQTGLAAQQGAGGIFAQLAGALQSGRLDEGRLQGLFSQLNRQSGIDLGQGLFEILQSTRTKNTGALAPSPALTPIGQRNFPLGPGQ